MANQLSKQAARPVARACVRFARKPLVLALTAATMFAAAPAAWADDAALRAEIAELRAQMAELKAQMKELTAQAKGSANQAAAAPSAQAPSQVAARPPTASPSSPPSSPASSPPSTQQAAAATSAQTTALAARVDRLEQSAANTEPRSGTTLFSYGEIAYSRPRQSPSDTQFDLARAVLGFGHQFDERTRVAGEFEWEHAVTSAEDQGEAEVEQLYVERQFSERFGGRAGLMLVPLGLINENHEPTAYYGVFRNFVETAIIPTTWREGGIALYGGTDNGFRWNVGLTSGFDLSKWDASSEEGRESPLRSIHQELQLAKARDLSIYVSANYQGVPGLLIGGGVFTGKAAQGTEDFAAPDARVTLWEGHARWQTGPFDLSALYAHGNITDTENLNLTFIGQPTPVPKTFWGAYVQGAWHAWSSADYSLTPFTRYEWVNTAASYEPVPQGLGVPASPTEGIWTIGVNFNVTPNIVFKADYQKFKVDTLRDRFDLGMGYQF